jgi:hypothetical protein
MNLGLATVIVAGDNPVLTALQAGELDQHFEDWKRQLSVSLANYQVTGGKLADGSPYTIESNSGIHTVTVWPVPLVIELAELLHGVSCIPADTTNKFGYVKPYRDEEGDPIKGTPKPGGNNFVMAVVPWRYPEEVVTPGKPTRGIELPDPNINRTLVAGFPQISSVNDIHREWVEPSRLDVVVSTALGVVAVNGVSYGAPDAGILIWGCIANKTDSLSGDVSKHVLAVTCQHPNLRFYTKGVSNPKAAWTLKATVNMTPLNPSATNGAKALQWARKCDRNLTGNVASVWLQNPDFTDDRLVHHATETYWAWVVDFDINDNATTTTAATRESVSRTNNIVVDMQVAFPPEGFPVNDDDFADIGTETFTMSGSRQIDFDYEGDVKVFTTLEFSGGHVVSRLHDGHQNVTFPNPPGGDISYFEALGHGGYVGDKKIVLKKGATTITTLYEEITTESYDNNGHTAAGVQDFNSTVSWNETRGYLLWHGKDTYVVLSINWTLEWAGPDEQTFTLPGDITRTKNLDLFRKAVKVPLATPTSYEGVTSGAAMGGGQLHGWTQEVYTGSATAYAGENGINSMKMDFLDYWDNFEAFGGKPDGHALSEAVYRRYVTAGSLDNTFFNFRQLKDFYLMSNPRYTLHDESLHGFLPEDTAIVGHTVVISETTYDTTCSHPAVLEALMLSASTDVAKNIRLF